MVSSQRKALTVLLHFAVESIVSSAENDVNAEEQHQHQYQYQYHHQNNQPDTTSSNADDSKLATEECHLKTIHDLKHEISLLPCELNGFKSAKGADRSSCDTYSATTAPVKHKIRGRWTDEEHELFLEGYNLYGRKWKKVAGVIKTRTMVQTRTHAQKYFKRMAKLADAKRKKSVTKIFPGPSTYRHSISRDRNSTSTIINPDNSVGRSFYPVFHSTAITPTSAMKLQTVPRDVLSTDGHNIQTSRTKPIFRTSIPQLPSIEVNNQQEEDTLVPPSKATKAKFQSSDWNQSEIEDFAETLDLLETIC